MAAPLGAVATHRTAPQLAPHLYVRTEATASDVAGTQGR